MHEVVLTEMQRSVSWSLLQATYLRSILTRTIKQLTYKLTSYANNPTIWLSGNFNSPGIEWQNLTVPLGSTNILSATPPGHHTGS